MSRSARDVERARVYAAEVLAFGDTLADATLHLADLQLLAELLFSQEWWIDASRGSRPTVRAARRDARRSVATSTGGGPWTIRIAPGHAQPPTLTHEAAHVLWGVRRPTGAAPTPVHGAGFRAAHLAVAQVVLGSHGAALLAEAYRGAGLTWSAPEASSPAAWPTPPDTGPHGLYGAWRNARTG